MKSNIIYNIVGDVETSLVCIDEFMNCYKTSKFETKY